MIVYLNGKFMNARDAKISVFDPGFLYGDGIFETLRTYNGAIWQMAEHLERLFISAKMRGWKLSWDAKELAAAIEKTVAKNAREIPVKRHGGRQLEFRVRVTITPGAEKPTLFIWVQPLENIPASAYVKGVSVITFPLERPFPQMKTTSMQPLLIARAEMAKKRAFEALLINHKGNITEGTWTNFFIVKKKVIAAPKIGVLLGTTRETILRLAKPLFRTKLKDISRRELLRADECFLTNAPKGIIPVVRVDGEKIGTGRVGPVTRHLMKKFDEQVWKK